MSTNFMTEVSIPMSEMFDGRLLVYGIHQEVVPEQTTSDQRCLADGTNYVWVYGDTHVELMTRYAGNAASFIVGAISECFSTVVYSENEPQYSGFEWEEHM